MNSCYRAELSYVTIVYPQPLDGALLAYQEIVAEKGSAPRIVHDKLGVISKSPS